MTGRQLLMKLLYPLIIRFSNARRTIIQDEKAKPHQSFFELQINLNNGQSLETQSLKGKKVLLVNTASNCGYTPQYKQLQELQDRFQDQLTVVGFPSNDFKEQEKGDDEEIQQFCQVNFGVNFPLAKKSVVINKPGQNEIFQWLTKKELNGWNTQQPKWNFSKYLIDEEGALTHYFDPAVAPLSKNIIEAIENK